MSQKSKKVSINNQRIDTNHTEEEEEYELSLESTSIDHSIATIFSKNNNSGDTRTNWKDKKSTASPSIWNLEDDDSDENDHNEINNTNNGRILNLQKNNGRILNLQKPHARIDLTNNVNNINHNTNGASSKDKQRSSTNWKNQHSNNTNITNKKIKSKMKTKQQQQQQQQHTTIQTRQSIGKSNPANDSLTLSSPAISFQQIMYPIGTPILKVRFRIT
jgi:hypothetical protein